MKYFKIILLMMFVIPFYGNAQENNTLQIPDLETYKKLLESTVQETESFSFKCNCEMSKNIIDDKSQLVYYEFETLDKIGLYSVAISQIPSTDEIKTFDKFIEDIKNKNGTFNYINLDNQKALVLTGKHEIQDAKFYYRTVLFFVDGKLCVITFGSGVDEITAIVLDGLLDSFQLKK